MKRTANFLLASLLIFERARTEFSDQCYINSNSQAGVQIGTSYSDMNTLRARINELTETHRSAAVNTCTKASDGTLMGIQIGLADYQTTETDLPRQDELIWLPGLGDTTADSNKVCETIIIERTAGITKWELISDTSGILMSAY